MKIPDYAFKLRCLSDEEGGGWLVTFPDLPGCMSDGETPEEAIENSVDAVESWIKTAQEFGDRVPKPNGPSGKFVLRVPKTLHARLIARAKQEETSMNTLAVTFLAEGLEKQHRS